MSPLPLLPVANSISLSWRQQECAVNTLAELLDVYVNITSGELPRPPVPGLSARYFWMWVAFLPVVTLMLVFCAHDVWWRATVRARKQQQEEDQEVEELASHLARRLAPSLAVESYRFSGMQRKNASVSLGFKDLGLTLKNGRTVLDGVTGNFGSGHLAAIMGPSGAGKTTFMNVLCGKATYGTMTGQVFVNDEEKDIRDLKPVTGFVPQDDIVHEHLTVREQLRFSAELRGQAGTPSHVLEAVVDDVLEVMQISHIQESIVGGVEERGISGGQRKRVNIGLELAACPSLLFLDEPTSGLDATSSLMIINSLKKMTQLGMTIVMVIHQPRYSLFTLFDEVLLLGKGGRTVYLGPSVDAVGHFEGLGFQRPPSDNPADWLMDVISGTVKSTEFPEHATHLLFDKWAERGDGEAASCAAAFARQASRARNWTVEDDAQVIAQLLEAEWEKVGAGEDTALGPRELRQVLGSCLGSEPSLELTEKLVKRLAEPGLDKARRSDVVDFFVGAGDLVRSTGGDLEQGSAGGEPRRHALVYAFSNLMSRVRTDRTASSTRGGSDLERRVPGWLRQYRVLLCRSLVQFWRHTKRRLIDNALIIGCAVVAAELHTGQAGSPNNVMIFQLGLALLTTVSCLKTFFDRALFWRESASGMNVFSFFLARTTLDGFDVVLQTLLYTSVYYLLAAPQVDFGAYIVPCLMLSVATSGWGYLLSALVPPCSATTAGVILMLVLGGILGNPGFLGSAINGGLSEIVASFSVLRWSLQMFLLRFWELRGGLKYPAAPAECEQLTMSERFSKVQGTMQELGTVRGDIYLRDSFMSGVLVPWFGYWYSGIVALAVQGLVLRILGYLALKFTNRSKQV